jgi:CHAT domain-containing protein/Flp pilus assembly protein TadD
MDKPDSFSAYLKLAEQVFDCQIKLSALSKHISLLPTFDRDLLEQLTEESEKEALNRPRMSWIICFVAEKACLMQKLDIFTCSLAAWYLGRAANHWVQPQKAKQAIDRARRGFKKLNEPGWLAACDWQENACVWMIVDLQESEKKLENACRILENYNFSSFFIGCQLTLVQVQLLLNQFSKANKILTGCETYYQEMNDDLNLARCWLIHADFFQREKLFTKAKEYIALAQNVFMDQKDTIDEGLSHYYSGIIFLFSLPDAENILAQFSAAIEIFLKTNLDLLQGMCLTYMGITCMQVGRYREAEKNYQKADRIFSLYHAESLLAQNLTAFGKLNILTGDSQSSIAHLLQAKKIHQKNKRTLSIGIDETNLGEAFFLQSRYQDCLHAFESASEIMAKLGETNKLGLIQLNIAKYYLFLNQYKQAEKFILLAEKGLIKSNQLDSLVTINQIKSQIWFLRGNYLNAQEYLLQNIDLLKNTDLISETALTYQNLGELFISWGKGEKAFEFLTKAFEIFQTLNAKYEIASCKIALGNCLKKENQLENARALFQQALEICQNQYKELEWRSLAGLADIEVPSSAINLYHEMIRVLENITSDFFQPNLAGAYSEKPENYVSKAINCAISLEKIEDALFFVESRKAHSLVSQLDKMAPIVDLKKTKQVKNILAEINLLQTQKSSTSIFSKDSNIETEKNRLNDLLERYEEQISSLERKNIQFRQPVFEKRFKLSDFRRNANQHFGDNWIAFDYYFIDSYLLIIIITQDKLEIRKIESDHHLQLLIKHSRNKERTHPQVFQETISQLGKIILPEDQLKMCSSDSTIIISPHQQLHGLPWAALGEKPLVQKGIPIVIPSLSCLQRLWNRQTLNTQERNHKGLLLGISNFSEKYPKLDYINQEISRIEKIFQGEAQRIKESEITLANINQVLHNSTEQSPLQWLHLATHFFTDSKTGRLGGFALHNEDIYLDQLRELYPLPSTLIFSGCSSLYSKLFPGDEHISLSSTCFLAGANNIVGSIWQIEDASVLSIMDEFYNNFYQSNPPSKSLALAQRSLINSGAKISDWCSYCCFGIE